MEDITLLEVGIVRETYPLRIWPVPIVRFRILGDPNAIHHLTAELPLKQAVDFNPAKNSHERKYHQTGNGEKKRAF